MRTFRNGLTWGTERQKPHSEFADGEVLYRDAINWGDNKSAAIIAEQLASDLTGNGRAMKAARILKKLSQEISIHYRFIGNLLGHSVAEPEDASEDIA